MEKDMKQKLKELAVQMENASYWFSQIAWDIAEGNVVADDETLDIMRDIRGMIDTIRFRKIKRLEKKLG